MTLETTPLVSHTPAHDVKVGLDISVRFAETDAMGIVHHSTYILWFEAGRIAWMDAVGVPYAEFAEAGYHFAVIGVEADYRTPARFGDTVRVISSIAAFRSRQVIFDYEVRQVQSGLLLATGRSRHICVDLDGRTAKIPDAFRTRLEAGMDHLVEQRRHDSH